jgi:hypothetical protein
MDVADQTAASDSLRDMILGRALKRRPYDIVHFIGTVELRRRQQTSVSGLLRSWEIRAGV